MKAPSGHLALKVEECGAATEDKRSISFTITANPRCEDAPLLVKEAPDTKPVARQPASSSAGTPSMSDVHAC
eukprot:7808798-Pyramimonas_sp.AAC.1